MKISIDISPDCQKELTFQPIKLDFKDNVIENVFQSLKKPLGDFIKKAKYAHLQNEVFSKYERYLKIALGEFLIENKKAGHDFYKRFLKHAKDRNEENGEIIKNVLTGDSTYRNFSIPDDENTRKVGLYIYSISNEINGIKYIGSCYKKDKPNSFFKRVEGYGNIAPYNTLIDGQGTNVRINPKINMLRNNITYWICPQENDKNQILYYEKCLIKKIWENGNIIWNIQNVPNGSPLTIGTNI